MRKLKAVKITITVNQPFSGSISFTKTQPIMGLLYVIALFCTGFHDIVPTARVLPEAVEPYFFSSPSFVQFVLSTA